MTDTELTTEVGFTPHKKMNKNLELQKGRVEDFSKYWTTKLDLGWLTIKNLYSESFHDEEASLVAETESDWEYRQGTTTWYLPRVAGLTDETLENTVIHELVHILVSPIESEIAERYDKQAEFAVESVARAIKDLHHATNSPEWTPKG